MELSIDPAGVATLVLSAPGRGNSLDRPMLVRVEELCRGLPSAARVLLVRGAGEKAFSTGYHLPTLLSELSEGESVVDFAHHPLERALRALDAVPVPTIAVVQGSAIGAGCELALTCDIRLAAEGATFAMPPARLGILYSLTGLARLQALVGPAVAQELIYAAETVDAPRALALGLVNRVVPRAALEAEAAALAGRIAGNAPLSVRHHKALFRRLRPPDPDPAVLRQVAALRLECFRSEEFRERLRNPPGSRAHDR